MFKAIPFFNRWHPAVLDLYIERGLCEDPRGGVRLTTPRMQVHELDSIPFYGRILTETYIAGSQEATTFSDTQTPWDMWELLPTLDENISVLWLIPQELTPV